jgi:hemoglobin-like flavoprotein
MKTQIIAETWDALSPNQTGFVEAFYQRFFERFPAYRVLFPHKLDAKHLEKMVQTMALMAHLSDDRSAIAPHMHKVGAAHKPYDLKPRDLANFKTVFLETLEEHLGGRWVPDAAQAWSDAFDQVLIPLMREGSTGR